MKRFLLAGLVALTSGTAWAETDYYQAHEAGTVRLGGHVAIPRGGDVNEEHVTGGAQAVYQATRFLSFELAGAQLKDQFPEDAMGTGIEVRGNVDIDTIVIALTGRLELPVIEPLSVYAGAGVGFYHFDAPRDVTVTAVPPFDGIGAPTAFDVNIDDTFGYHWALGASLVFAENYELFAEYRSAYVDADLDFNATVTSVDGELLSRVHNRRTGYDHGMIRAGLNFYF